jgi:hypothetical protein
MRNEAVPRPVRVMTPIALPNSVDRDSRTEPPGGLRVGADPGEVALVAVQEVTVQVGDVRDASVATDEVTEPPQIPAVACHGAGQSVRS